MKDPEPDPYLVLMDPDPDPGGLKYTNPATLLNTQIVATCKKILHEVLLRRIVG